jgi:hypothetical protein
MQPSVRHIDCPVLHIGRDLKMSDLIGKNKARLCRDTVQGGNKKMIVSSPEILAQLGIDAAMIDNVLVIRGHGCRETVSTQRFHSFIFPGVSSFEARLITRVEGEIIINNSIIVPILSTCAENVPPQTWTSSGYTANGDSSGHLHVRFTSGSPHQPERYTHIQTGAQMTPASPRSRESHRYSLAGV